MRFHSFRKVTTKRWPLELLLRCWQARLRVLEMGKGVPRESLALGACVIFTSNSFSSRLGHQLAMTMVLKYRMEWKTTHQCGFWTRTV